MRKESSFLLTFFKVLLLSMVLVVRMPIFVDASELNAEEALLKITSGVSYLDTSGVIKEIEIPALSSVTVSATVTTVTIKGNNQTHVLKNVQELYLKNITITNFVSFSTNSISKIGIEGVDFKRGITFSKMQKLQTLTVKQTTFGAINYSFSVDSAPLLDTLEIDNSTLESDLLIYSNHSLSEATISNSILKSNAIQQNNKKGYQTRYQNTSFERNKFMKDISSGGNSLDDIFFINPNNTLIGGSKFNATEPGKIFYQLSNGTINTIDVPASIPVTDVKESKDTVSIKLENGQDFILTDIKELYFRNIDIQTSVNLTEKLLTLEKIQFVNSNVRNIHLANSDTLRTIEINNSDFLQSSGYIRIRENKNLETVVIQNSNMRGGGSTGYVMVYGSPLLKQFIMNNDYMSGYLYAKDIGTATLELSNSQFDDYITSNAPIKGEAGPQPVGYPPVIEGAKSVQLGKGILFDALVGVTATDIEDGDLTSVITVEGADKIDEWDANDYPVKYTVTDSDGNTTVVEIIVTVLD